MKTSLPEEYQSVNVARFLPLVARERPADCAVKAPKGRAPDGSIAYRERTFVELDREARIVAAMLRETGIGSGTRVLLMVRPGLDLIRTTFALFNVGAIPVVVDPGMGVRAFLGCVRSSQPQALVGIRAAHLLSRIFFPAFQSVLQRLVVGSPAFRRNLKSRSSRLVDGSGADALLSARTQGKDLAAILFTSGSTGPPKGVCYEHGMFEAQVELIRRAYGIEPGEIDLPILPIFALFNPALGMTTVVPEMNPSRPAAVEPERIVRAVQQCGVTNSFGSPVLWDLIARYCLSRNATMPTMRRILMAGAPVPPGLLRRYRKIIPNGEVHTPYGATESLPVTTIAGSEVVENTRHRTVTGGGTCVGRALDGIDLQIIEISDRPISDWSGACVLPPGEIGEIVVAGSVVTRAYDNLEAATRAAKIADNDRIWHRMGDVGYLDEAGRLWFCGRKAERFSGPSGILYTDCCEGVFIRHPKVCRAALIGFKKAGEQLPAVVIEPEQGAFPIRARRRLDFARELRLLGANHPVTAVIRTFFFIRRLPVDVRHNAKIHRLALARRCARRPSRAICVE